MSDTDELTGNPPKVAGTPTSGVPSDNGLHLNNITPANGRVPCGQTVSRREPPGRRDHRPARRARGVLRRRRVGLAEGRRVMNTAGILIAAFAQIAVNFAPAIVALVALALVARRQGWGL